IQRVRPTVELAGEHLTHPLGIPHELIAAVRAHVMEGANRAIFAAHDQDRGVPHRQVFDKIRARLGNLLHPTDVEPHFAKNSLAFFLEIRPRDVRLDGKRLRPQLRVAIMPLVAIRCLYCGCHRCSSCGYSWTGINRATSYPSMTLGWPKFSMAGATSAKERVR